MKRAQRALAVLTLTALVGGSCCFRAGQQQHARMHGCQSRAAAVELRAGGAAYARGAQMRGAGGQAAACFLSRLRLSAQEGGTKDSNPFFGSFLKVLDATLT
jgi:hypothetical protein